MIICRHVLQTNKSSCDFPQNIHDIVDQVTPFLATAEPWSENEAYFAAKTCNHSFLSTSNAWSWNVWISVRAAYFWVDVGSTYHKPVYQPYSEFPCLAGFIMLDVSYPRFVCWLGPLFSTATHFYHPESNPSKPFSNPSEFPTWNAPVRSELSKQLHELVIFATDIVFFCQFHIGLSENKAQIQWSIIILFTVMAIHAL